MRGGGNEKRGMRQGREGKGMRRRVYECGGNERGME